MIEDSDSFHSIYELLSRISYLLMITRTGEDVCTLYADITPLYVRNQCLVNNNGGQISLSHPIPPLSLSSVSVCVRARMHVCMCAYMWTKGHHREIRVDVQT